LAIRRGSEAPWTGVALLGGFRGTEQLLPAPASSIPAVGCDGFEALERCLFVGGKCPRQWIAKFAAFLANFSYLLRGF
jgi:hypothetical protein